MKKKRLSAEPETSPANEVLPEVRERPVIRASCPLFACRECRTRTGWPHKNGCELIDLAVPDCRACRYWSAKKEKCDHPEMRNGGDCR